MRLAGRVVLVVSPVTHAGRAAAAPQHALADATQPDRIGLVRVNVQFEHRAVVHTQGDMAQHRAARRVERDLDLAAVLDAEPPGIGIRQVQVAAREANALIDRRTFSWTELLNQFQSTLPPDVRIAGVLPQTDSEGRRLVQISVFSRRIEDLEAFMDALEKTGMFSGVLSRSDQPDESGTLQSELQAYYLPIADAASRHAPSSEPGKTPGNASAGTAA